MTKLEAAPAAPKVEGAAKFDVADTDDAPERGRRVRRRSPKPRIKRREPRKPK